MFALTWNTITHSETYYYNIRYSKYLFVEVRVTSTINFVKAVLGLFFTFVKGLVMFK